MVVAKLASPPRASCSSLKVSKAEPAPLTRLFCSAVIAAEIAAVLLLADQVSVVLVVLPSLIDVPPPAVRTSLMAATSEVLSVVFRRESEPSAAFRALMSVPIAWANETICSCSSIIKYSLKCSRR
ncbi:hypothetical protein D3C75_1037390 [compost metagenome]